MYARRVALRQFAVHQRIARQQRLRCLSTAPPTTDAPKGPTEPYRYEKPRAPASWLSKKVKESPWAVSFFLKLSRVLGHSSGKQIAGRRTLHIYEQVCCAPAEEDRAFWQDECDLPPTFQSWFTITNLHIWMLTVRLRALPQPHGKIHIQGLIDHFFLDVEDRVRYVLQPFSDGLPPTSSSYSVSPEDNQDTSVTKKKRGRAPDRLVSQQMRILKEQWAGLGMSFDLGLVTGDVELAGAVWRNLLGARGARGIPLSPEDATFRRSVNPMGSSTGKVTIKMLESGLESQEAKDDGSGVHDYPLERVDKYVTYPELMLDIVGYVRRELKRLEAISDDEIIARMKEYGKEAEGISRLKFGKVRR